MPVAARDASVSAKRVEVGVTIPSRSGDRRAGVDSGRSVRASGGRARRSARRGSQIRRSATHAPSATRFTTPRGGASGCRGAAPARPPKLAWTMVRIFFSETRGSRTGTRRFRTPSAPNSRRLNHPHPRRASRTFLEARSSKTTRTRALPATRASPEDHRSNCVLRSLSAHQRHHFVAPHLQVRSLCSIARRDGVDEAVDRDRVFARVAYIAQQDREDRSR